MRGIVADINIVGQVDDLVQTFLHSAEWIEIWQALNLDYLFLLMSVWIEKLPTMKSGRPARIKD